MTPTNPGVPEDVQLTEDARVTQDQRPYLEALTRYVNRGMTPVCTPGHHGYSAFGVTETFGAQLLPYDIQPLVEGIDRGTSSPLTRAMELAADAWGARRTFFLTNGASQGNLTACLALRGLGTSIVAQRSVHSSVIDGLAMSGLHATFVLPTIDHELGMAHGVFAEDLDAALAENPDAIAAYVVTPSYFGAISDVRALADVAHRHGAALVVDEAWGPHLGFHKGLPAAALSQGADLVISSTHKLGGSLTQTAMLHLAEGPYADALEPLVERSFRSMQSTSASAILLASLDMARHQLAVRADELIGPSIAAAQALRARLEARGRFHDAGPRILASRDVVALDPLHVVIDTRAGGISGHEARSILFEQHRMHLEIATDDVLVAIIGAGSTPDAHAIADAFEQLPDTGAGKRTHIEIPDPGQSVMDVRTAWLASTEIVAASDAVGRISADSVAAYPPGIPNMIPGEVITADAVEFLRATAAAPFGHVRGSLDPAVSTFRVVAP